MIVISDSTPLHYLVLIEKEEVLHLLFDRVVVPRAVVDELQHERTPAAVKQFVMSLPAWLEVKQVKVPTEARLEALGAGEREAIVLAQELRADLLLMDDKAGRGEALRRGLRVVGLLATLEEAAKRGFIDLRETLHRLRQTTFRISAEILDSLSERNCG